MAQKLLRSKVGDERIRLLSSSSGQGMTSHMSPVVGSDSSSCFGRPSVPHWCKSGVIREVLHTFGADGVGVKFPTFALCSKVQLFALDLGE